MTDLFVQAAIDGDIASLLAQLRAGRDPNLPDQFGWIALHRAAANNRAHAVRLLIEHGSNIESTGTDRWTPLHLAAISSSSDAVDALISAGANVGAQSKSGDTPLHLCVTSACLDCARLLLAGGARADCENGAGLTPIDKARSRNVSELIAVFEQSP